MDWTRRMAVFRSCEMDCRELSGCLLLIAKPVAGQKKPAISRFSVVSGAVSVRMPLFPCDTLFFVGLMFTYLLLFIFGLIAGRVAAVWAAATIDPAVPLGLRRCGVCSDRPSVLRQLIQIFPGVPCRMCSGKGPIWPFLASVSLAVLFSGFAWLLLDQNCQSVTEVRPSMPLWQNRLPFHLLFIFLLSTATITDFLDYVIPDLVVLPGALLAIIWATVSGELQMIHVWVDWDYDLVTLYGPYLPEWMKQHQHLHGLVWSVSGLLTGAGLMWAARSAAFLILGIPAIGFGDVTLMAMIGAFMGWQPTLCALAIAPLVGMVLGLGGRILTGRSFVAFGPYLCIAAFVVLCTWRALWEGLQLKIIFSHWPTIVGMVAGSFAAFGVLLVGLRLFRATPAERLR